MMSLKKITLGVVFASWFLMEPWISAQDVKDPRLAQFAEEVRDKGWIVYAARCEKNKTWDLFMSRPDGSQRSNMTKTADFEEAGPYYSQDHLSSFCQRNGHQP
jgi:hypothetical protein